MALAGSPPKSASEISPSLHQLLNAYTVAAVAAGVGVLSLAPTAEAGVVFTRIHKQIAANTVVDIDLNHDGIVDFKISYQTSFRNLRPGARPQEGTFLYSRNLFATGAQPSNMVESTVVNGQAFAAALAPRAVIGPEEPFQAGKEIMAEWVAAGNYTNGGNSGSGGPWIGVARRYLGFKFLIDGATHYGWARLNLGKYCTGPVLTGFAYETDPDKPIAAGQTAAATTAHADIPEARRDPLVPATLGILSRGSDGLAIWRRE
jgi:hypothetical protein